LHLILSKTGVQWFISGLHGLLGRQPGDQMMRSYQVKLTVPSLLEEDEEELPPPPLSDSPPADIEINRPAATTPPVIHTQVGTRSQMDGSAILVSDSGTRGV
jgi:hypothetical protein